MKKLIAIAFTALILTSCKKAKKEQTEHSPTSDFVEIRNTDYELVKPAKNTGRVLVLFGGYPEDAEDIKREFNILEGAKQKDIAVLFMNYNQKLWLQEDEKQQLAAQLLKIFKDHKLPDANAYFGGFSSGGNVALLISDYLTEKQSSLIPKGVFIVDSPIDLVALYKSSEKNIARNFSEVSVQESTWLLKTLGDQFGNPENTVLAYQKYAVYTSRTETIDNIKNLKNTKLRLYTEPDTLWWKENRRADYDQMNAYYLERLSKTLKKSGFDQVTYIPTKNKGYRADGTRHPHSWAIVDPEELIHWILE
ncbi:hypothetical protein J8L85_15755 [Maribacter sp. MMG018]|uniref:hypothetical protein n=1 Tax=Maribacter sp. MMG018 TaxID=2822688 RepID=UPI001B36A165|nr:hypothetical protein [Maribacter sp. MMG018]MBQ4915910.1 hypothetical protein [Maribacter sp. MMG018]